MSGQWEVVGSKKNKQSKLPVPKGNEKPDKKKKNVLNGVKIEEVLPKSQVQNLYGNQKSNKDNGKPKEKSKPQETKKPQQKKVEKQQEAPKPKAPKSIESALNSIDKEEFKSIYEKTKNLYPEAPIVWLKELVQYLNQKVPVELNDPVFTTRPQGYPFNIVPAQVKAVIEKSIKEAGKSNTQLFFDIALTSMATEMSKGSPALGWKFFLQYIASNEPKAVAANITKHITLEKSYQNRPNIGLSILWAVGQVGFADFHSGFAVFEELMLPLIEMKNYSRFIVKYLLDLISSHKEVTLTKDEYLLILDTVYSNKKNFPNDLRSSLTTEVEKLKSGLFSKNSKDKYHTYVDLVLKKITTNSNKSYQNCLSDVLVEVFAKDSTTLNNWFKVYSKNVSASAVVLKYISDNWKNVSSKLNKKALVELLNNLQATNEELSAKKKKDEGLTDSILYVKKIQEKMVVKKQSSFGRWLKWYFSLVFVAITLLVVMQAVNCIKGSASPEYHEFCQFSNNTYKKLAAGFSFIDEKIETQLPNYKKTVSDVSAPYIKLVQDLGLVSYNLAVNIKNSVQDQYPVMIQFCDSYAPGYLEAAVDGVGKGYNTGLQYYRNFYEYLSTQVFVGKLSPGNMQKVFFVTLNQTQNAVSEYYFWLYEKVQTSIK